VGTLRSPRPRQQGRKSGPDHPDRIPGSREPIEETLVASGIPLYRSGMGRETSDEAYVVGLCEEVLGAAASRQHRFDWLTGDPGRDGRGRPLPVDAYWPDLGLVLEYRERQHDRATPFFDKPDRMTVSGIHRGEQRKLYDRRREELIPAHGLRLLVVQTDDLDSDGGGRLRRNAERDRAVLERLLADAGAEERRPLLGAAVAACLPAQDLDRARRWYAETLGLHPAEERPDGLRYVVGRGEVTLSPSAGRADGSFPQLTITVPDLAATVAELRRRGVAFEEPAIPGVPAVGGIAGLQPDHPGGGIRERVAWFRDSEGNLLRLTEAPAAPSPE
jgi:catechol 2,3-dioxygenase-like lactoylglutathione lyase family enzyme